MSAFHKSSSWGQVLGVFAGSTLVIILLFYLYDALKPPFFTTKSPDNTYSVNLYGQKERPALFTVEVGAVVLKNEQPFWPYQTLHTGDAMDLSFELGWPDHRWIGDNVLQFYREENFSELKLPERLVLVNKTDKVIRQLRITSNNDKFLGFDLPPGSEIRLAASPPRGDYSGVWIAARLNDGRIFENKAIFDVSNVLQPLAYRIVVTDEGVNIVQDTVDAP
ncbi:MAG: hypothetical protein ACKVRN_11045 [Pyrinomonadaceae bacterium]